MEVFLDDHVLDGVHGRLQQGRIRGIGVVDIDLAIWHPVDAAESVREVSGSRVQISIGAAVVWKVLRYRGDGEFPLEKVDFIEEKDDWLAFEPFPIYQGLEKHHRFVHLVLGSRLEGMME